MNWDDAELRAAWEAGQNTGAGAWSEEDLRAAWQAGQPKEEAPIGIGMAAQFLGGIKDLGTALQSASDIQPGAVAQSLIMKALGIEEKKPDLGQLLDYGIDAATGRKGTTEIGSDSLTGKFARYLPSALAGPGSLGKKVAGNALSSLGGYLGAEFGPTGEAIGAVGVPLTVTAAAQSAKSAAPFIADAARKIRLSAYGAGKNQINKAINRMPDVLDDAGDFINPISESLDSFRSAGGGAKSMEGAVLLKDLKTQIDDRVGPLKALLNDAQKNQKDVIIPAFTYTDEYVNGLSGADKEAAIEMAQKLKAATLDNTDGTLLGLQSEKEKLGASIADTAWGDDPASRMRQNILKRVRADLRRTIEDSYSSLTGKSSKEISSLNKEIGQRQGLIPLFKDLIASGEARNPIAHLIQSLRTSGGFGQLGIMGSVGSAGYLYPPSLVPIALGAYATTPSGRRASSDLMKAFAGRAQNLDAPILTGGAAPSAALAQEYSSALSGYLARQLGIAGSEQSEGDPLLEPRSSLEKESKASEGGSAIEAQTPIAPKDLSEVKSLAVRPSARSFNDSVDKAISNAEAKAMTNSNLKEAQGGDVDLDKLVSAVIKQESGGNAKAVSHKGARGLMQIMPKTAKEIAGELGYEDYDLEDPETNREFGTYYLKKMLDMFKGDMELALAAYNAGPGRVRKWIGRYGPKWADIAEAIERKDPKHETLKYVIKVKRNLDQIEV